jgi:hypothetical protein
MLPYVNLSLSRDGVVIAQGANGAYAKLINSEVCVPAYQSVDLMTHFELPASVGNEAQDSSLWILYTFRYTIGDCNVVAPEPSIPSPPSTGDSMMPFLVVGGFSAFSLVLLLILAVTFLLPLLFKRRKGEKEEKVDS